jgi:hypothetical protein
MESTPSPAANAPTATARTRRGIVSLRARSLGFGVMAAAMLVLLIALGSRGFHWFDEALIGYAVGAIFATAAVVYKYTYWLARPQTQRYWRRSWQLFLSWTNFRRYRGLIPRTIVTDLLTQQFIRRRSVYRWIMHLCIFWGVVLSCLITFPLTFGWLRFTQAPLGQYQLWFFGFPLFSFAPDSPFGILVIHALDWTALLLLLGLVMALHRRFHDLATLAVQRFRFDIVPLGLLLAIAVTGLALTADNLWLGGAYYWFISLTHEAVVVLWLISLPFGKFFHLIERPATLGVDLYWQASQDVEMQACPRCGTRFAPALFLRDLKRTLSDVGEDYTLPVAADFPPRPASAAQAPPGEAPARAGATSTLWWSDLCPQCKRVLRAQAHLAALDPDGNRFL